MVNMVASADRKQSKFKMKWKTAMKEDWVRASVILGLILIAVFFPVLWGSKTLLMSAWDAPSIMPSGAYDQDPLLENHISRTPDAGAPAWLTEPWLKIVSDQYWTEHNLPLWNPYSAYGTPLAADMQSQPFYPLTFLLSLHPTAWTYNFFIIARLFVAGVLMFLFARLFLAGVPSLFAAITFMLTGYFILFLNMPHLSVEVLLPGVFLAFELILRKNSWGAVAGTAGVIFLCMVGGMPESVFLFVSFGCLYFLFRLTFTPEFRERPFACLGKLAAALALGFALSAFLLLPFLEFVRIAHDTHQPSNMSGAIARGLESDGDMRVTVTYLLPMIFGGVFDWTGMRGYWGVVPCLFAVAAVLCWFFPKNISYPKPLRSLTVFFGISLALMLLKRFGHPIINWIGLLPLSEMVVYTKYQEPLMAFCVAMLAGISFSLLAEYRAKSAFFLIAAMVVLDVILALAGWSLPQVIEHPESAAFYLLSVLAGVFLVQAAALLLMTLLLLSSAPTTQVWVVRGFLGLLLLELSFNFIAPDFYIFNSLPSEMRSPFAGAPYLDLLRTRNTEHDRLFARDGILHPNWAGAFEMADVRNIDALYYRRYRNFIRNFLPLPGDEDRRKTGRFTGLGFPYDFDTDVEKRFLALSSVRYLIGVSEYGLSSKVREEIVEQHRAENLPAFGPALFQMGDEGNVVRGFLQHPPSRRLTYKTVIDPQRPIFEAIAAIKSEVHDKSDGVSFLLEIKSGENIEKLFSTILNPKEIPADRAGRLFRVDLSQYAGKEVELLFSTDPGPSGNTDWDWGGWAKLRFVPRDKAETENVREEIVEQHRAENLPGFGPEFFQVGDEGNDVVRGFLQHPPSRQLTYKTVIDPQRPIFEAIAAIKSEVHDKSDGVSFLLEIKSGENIEKLFSTILNPKEIPADRAGRLFRVDLSQYAGKEVELLFSTDPGPSGNTDWDWGGWAKLRFVPRDKAEARTQSPFNKLYDKEVSIYEVPWVLPRASLFHAVEVLPEDEVLLRLKSPVFNPDEKVVLSRESLSEEDLTTIRLLSEAPATPVSAARISLYESQRVRIQAETPASAVLMLNDANYPGWRAYVNGKPASISHANYLFRGVILPAGRSTVEFVYEPVSFRLGALISIAALAALVALALRGRTRRVPRAAPPTSAMC